MEYQFPETDLPPFSSPPAIISQFLDEAELYVVGCKQHYLIESYFLFVDDTIKQLVAEDEQKFTSNFKDKERNTMIGFNYLDFKFTGNDSDSEMINSITYSPPFLPFSLFQQQPMGSLCSSPCLRRQRSRAPAEAFCLRFC